MINRVLEKEMSAYRLINGDIIEITSPIGRIPIIETQSKNLFQLCQAITEDSTATLGTAIKRLTKQGIQLHSAMEGAWGKLYGYTSDQRGIRHALSDGEDISFAEAKYMLVSCSAFVSYLIQLAQDAGIALD
jgi:hypothetical protein